MILGLESTRNLILYMFKHIKSNILFNKCGNIAILTEHIFSWPGLGSWLYAAVSARDIRPIQGGVLFVACIFMMINLGGDLLYACFNPQIRIVNQAV